MATNIPTPAAQTGRISLDDVRPQGYHRLANIMGPYTDIAIFRRFGSLNMVNLLYRQAELMELERKFKDIYLFDTVGAPGIPPQPFSVDFRKLRESSNTAIHDQLDILDTIQRKLSEYNTALLQAAKLARLGKPDDDDLGTLRNCLFQDEDRPFLCGTETETWNDERDLITLHSPAPEDQVILPWFSDGLLNVYHALFGSRSRTRKRVNEEDILVYDDANIERANKIMITIIASILPIVAIIVLYAVKSTWKRIYIMIAFTLTFALSLAMFTSARRLDIFAATAAFAAVEVVFIGSVAS